MSEETKTNDEVIASNPIETGGTAVEQNQADYKVDLKTGSTKKKTEKSNITKVDLSKKPEADAIPIGETKKVVVGEQTGDSVKVDEQVPESSQATEEFTQIQEVSKEEVKQVAREVKEAIRDEKVLGKALPENIEKLVTFMEDTGGTIED